MSPLHSAPLSYAPAAPDLTAQIEGMLHELRATREAVVGQIDAQIARANGLLRHVQENAPTQMLVPPTPTVLQAPPKLTSVVLAAPEAPGIDPELEKATLAELNEALSLAFTEIASRGGLIAR